MPKFTYSKKVLKRFMSPEDFKRFNEEYNKHKKKRPIIGNLVCSPANLKCYKELGKTMDIGDVARELNISIETALRRMGKICLIKHRKIKPGKYGGNRHTKKVLDIGGIPIPIRIEEKDEILGENDPPWRKRPSGLTGE